MSLKNFKVISKLGKQSNNFINYSNIGEGAFTTVYRVRRKSDNTVYALKKVKLSDLNEK